MLAMLGPLCCLLFCCPVLDSIPTRVRHPLPVLWMRPADHRGVVNMTVQLALQELSKQAPPLGNYDIQLDVVDLQCDVSAALKALFDAMWTGPKYRLLFGGACPSVTPLVARALPAFRMVQVSFAAPSLSNRKWCGNTFSTVPSGRAVSQAAVKLLQRYRWTRVGVIAQEGSEEIAEDLSRQLMKAGLELVSMTTLRSDACSGLMDMMEHDVRIFIILTHSDEDSVSQVFCCASRLKLFASGHQWIVAGGEKPGWKSSSQVSNCTADDVLAVADGAIWLQVTRVGITNMPGVSGRMPQHYQDVSKQQVLQHRAKVSLLNAFAYDAVWVAAIALCEVMEAVKRRAKYNQNISVSEEEVTRELLDAMKRTHFDGMTGPIAFQDGERMTSIQLIQSQGDNLVVVGQFVSHTQQLRLAKHLIKFKDQTQVRVSKVVSAVATLIAAVSLLVLCVIAIKFCTWYDLDANTAASQDAMLLLAVLFSAASVLATGLDDGSLPRPTLHLLCSVRLWVLLLGQTLGYSAVFIQTWQCFSRRARVPPPCYMALVLALLDVFVLTTWQMVDPLRRVVTQHRPESDSAHRGVVMLTHTDGCSSINMELWTTILYAYKAPLLGLGCFVAWNIRRRSTSLALSMLAVVAFSVAGACAWPLLSHNPSLHFCVTSTLILACDLLVLTAMLGVKLINSTSNISQLQSGGGGATEGGTTGGRTEEKLNRLLKHEKAELDAQIDTLCEALEAQLGQSAAGSASGLLFESCVYNLSSHSGGPAAEVRSEAKEDPTDVNAPDLVRRRLSVQLPILHHSYLPVIGGVSASSSAHFGRWEAFMCQDARYTTSRTHNSSLQL
ncbi:gamma-aminobutyric acid type B receptor subunit 2-like [Dunckerocampus dactyliophorus]|uniref:gamma-aminobutyric acid type B receptor subunit 2-like n=1 Tax=Dunckerocampus dactyliophorus TaxID=161453 RepID=UPI00240649BD|nr:gamma-aminobutyric acid type B receptor subunit 2-like [Dunckerocampus dactyliophorus]